MCYTVDQSTVQTVPTHIMQQQQCLLNTHTYRGRLQLKTLSDTDIENPSQDL